jgi:sialate O-acetylesterase
MKIHHGLSAGQVLQRLRNNTASAIITGSCETDGPVTVRVTQAGRALKGFRDRRIGSASCGSFQVQFKGLPVGGPYNVTLAVGNRRTIVPRVWVGDVWLLGGQSNMEGYGNRIDAPKPHPKVHAMYFDRRWDLAREPIHFPPESPDRSHYAEAPIPASRIAALKRQAVKGVGPGIFFGTEMVRRSGGVPQGLICVSKGGSSMEQWDPAKKHLGGESLYGSMWISLRQAAQPVAGVLWYQGESDAGPKTIPVYTKRMKELVAAIRRDLNQPHLPFLMVQLGRCFGVGTAPNFCSDQHWNAIQAQQLALRNEIPFLDCVAAVDLALSDRIHVGSDGYARLGMRLARLADRIVYGNRKELPAPELASVHQVRDREACRRCAYSLELTFRNVVGGLRPTEPGMAHGFSLVNRNFIDADTVYRTTVRGNRVILETALPNNLDGEFRLMYGYGITATANVTDGRDMPVPVFGPVAVERVRGFSPFMNTWRTSAIQKATRKIAQVAMPKPTAAIKLVRRVFPTTLVDMHEVWNGRSGQCFFYTTVSLEEDMALNLRFGYDGPVKLWVDRKAVFCDPNGTNPAIPDQKLIPLRLKRGQHEICVGMDLNGGRAWGFFMRFNRRDLPKVTGKDEQVPVPVCVG